jgi:LemA protein
MTSVMVEARGQRAAGSAAKAHDFLRRRRSPIFFHAEARLLVRSLPQEQNSVRFLARTFRTASRKNLVASAVREARFGETAMNIVLILLGVLVVGAVLVLLGIVSAYNHLVSLRNRFKNAYSQIDVQLKRRYDLIPNLVETAKGYLQHERATLDEVIAARNTALNANAAAAQNPGSGAAIKQVTGAEAALTGSLGRLFAVVEAYPNLTANEEMIRLMEELTSTENKVAFARQAYNDSVMAYNTGRETFPANLIANAFHFTAAELFVVDKPEEKEVVKVSFP